MTCLIHINLAIIEDFRHKVSSVVLGSPDECRRAVRVDSPVGVNAGVSQEQLGHHKVR